jgi:endoplasmic reticulum Man9GlcNAc2 1,2-alpha-mannosidase
MIINYKRCLRLSLATLLLLLVSNCSFAQEVDQSELDFDARVVLSFQNPDSGSRCRLSGICDLNEAERERICWNRTFDSRLSPDAGLLFPGFVAQERDLEYECLIKPNERIDRIKQAMAWSWNGYEKCASGEDELLPLTCSGQHWFNLTLTAVDSLDTLLIAGLEDEYLRAIEMVREKAFTRTSGNCNVFETTIRILGGALSAYFELEGDFSDATKETRETLLKLAVDVGSRLYVSFRSNSGLPFSDVNLLSGETSGSVPQSSLSEMTTLALEFTALSRLTGDPKFEDAARSVYDILSDAVAHYEGLLPQFFSPQDGKAKGRYIMLGARTDSYYEYLLKQWIFTGKTDDLLKDRYIHAMQSIRKKLFRRTSFVSGGEHQDGLLYVSEIKGNTVSSKMDHLVCFLPGLFALGHFHGISTALPMSSASPNEDSGELERNKHMWKDDLYIAQELSNTCYELYRQSPTGLAPEIAHFFEAETEYPHNHMSDIGGGYFYVKDLDAHNILRPETVESLFILWKVTGDPKYRERSWQIFRAFERWSRIEGLEHCLLTNDTLYQEVGMIIVHECLNRVTDALSAGGSVADENGKIFTMVSQFFEATRLSDVPKGDGSERLVSWTKDLVVNYVHIILQALGSGVLQPGTSQPLNTQTMSCLNANPSYGYAGIKSVLEVPPKRMNKMESFWMAETLKYFYLIFSEPPDRCLHPSCAGKSIGESRYPLSKYVLNTEAHFLPIVGPKYNSSINSVHLEGLESMLNPFDEHGNECMDDQILDPSEYIDEEDVVDDGVEIPYNPPDLSVSSDMVAEGEDQNILFHRVEPPKHMEL